MGVRSEAGGQGPEVRSRRSEVGEQTSDLCPPTSGFRLLLAVRRFFRPGIDEQADGRDSAVCFVAAGLLAARPLAIGKPSAVGDREDTVVPADRGGVRGDVCRSKNRRLTQSFARTVARGAIAKRGGVVRPLSGKNFLAH